MEKEGSSFSIRWEEEVPGGKFSRYFNKSQRWRGGFVLDVGGGNFAENFCPLLRKTGTHPLYKEGESK